MSLVGIGMVRRPFDLVLDLICGQYGGDTVETDFKTVHTYTHGSEVRSLMYAHTYTVHTFVRDADGVEPKKHLLH